MSIGSENLREEQDLLYSNIKKIIEKKGFSLKRLSEEIGMSLNGIYSAFNNYSLKVETLIKIKNVLGVDFHDLFDYSMVKDRELVIINKKLSESENLVSYLREKKAVFDADYDIELLARAKSLISDWHSLLSKEMTGKMLDDLVYKMGNSSELILGSISCLANIIEFSSNSENVKNQYRILVLDIRKMILRRKAIRAKKLLKKIKFD